MEEPVTIVDRDVLKVLAVDTRMDILKELSQGNRTPSDLGKRLNKTDATIVEHLNALCKAGLVNRTEQPGKKWVFYSLTERGYGIIKSKSRKLIIVIATSLLSGVIGLGGIGKYMLENTRILATKEASTIMGETAAAAVAPTPWLLYFSIGLIALSVIGISFYFIQKSKIKGG
jgi:DNA-binding transcriptional ArsR family regulator